MGKNAEGKKQWENQKKADPPLAISCQRAAILSPNLRPNRSLLLVFLVPTGSEANDAPNLFLHIALIPQFRHGLACRRARNRRLWQMHELRGIFLVALGQTMNQVIGKRVVQQKPCHS